MKKIQKTVIYTFSREKIDEFKDMSIRQRLQWLEVANRFINKTAGIKKSKKARSDAPPIV